MHQQARPPPRLSASPASSPQMAQAKTASPRDAVLASRLRSGSNVSGRESTPSPPAESPVTTGLGLPADSIKKLDQIVQNFFNKAAVLIIESRMKVKPTRNANGQRKTNKWFQIETDESEDFKNDLRIWKTCGSMDNHPPPLIVDIYLDTSSLKESQSLVTIDDDGRRWDVLEQLNSSESSPSSSYHTASTSRNAEVVLERWRIDLKTSGSSPMEDFGPILPTIYKKAIVFFRSLFITTKLLPAWKFASQGAPKNAHPALVPQCRILLAEPGRTGTDLLKRPINGRRDPVTEYVFGDLEVPVGRLSTTVVYRNDCSFRIDDSESLLSSRFMGVDENLFKPSLRQRADCNQGQVAESGSLRDHRRGTTPSDMHQTYGSMSTFHGDGPLGASPLSALRAVKSPGSDTSSPPATLPTLGGLVAGPSSMPTSGRISTAPRAVTSRPENVSRRTSISFQPFKAGSLSGSPVPRHMEPESSASTHAQSRPGLLIGSQPRNRSSLTVGMPASLRGGPSSTPVDAPPAGSPRTGRYSSSFTHRRGRASIGRAGDDEQSSSGRQSLASSVAQPGSGLLAEAGGTSSGSLHAEEDDISDFLKALDSRKTLKTFEPTNRGDSATNRTVAQLSKFHLMRDSNNALTESMTSSMQMQRSSSSSSRQLTSLPGIVAPVSMSVSSSPGKAVSPHTPHMPAVPSRLSENSIIDYTATRRVTSRAGRRQAPTVPEVTRESTITQKGTTAIDIPLSPRITSYQRRSSSAAQQRRAVIDDEDTDLAFAAHRSISLGANEGDAPTIGIRLGRRMQIKGETSDREDATTGRLQPAADTQPSDASTFDMMQRGSNEDNLPNGLISSAGQSGSAYPRRRYAGMGAASKGTPPQSSRGSFTGSLSRMGRGDDESVGEEPLVFDLSEMDAHSRRSLDDGRGGRNTSSERSAFEPRGISRRGW